MFLIHVRQLVINFKHWTPKIMSQLCDLWVFFFECVSLILMLLISVSLVDSIFELHELFFIDCRYFIRQKFK